MNTKIVKITFWLLGYLAITTLNAQNLEDLSFGSENTLDIITWNIERFPKNSQTINYATEIIQELDADIIALQEINSISSFNQLVDNLQGYSGYSESVHFRGLTYIYKTDAIQIHGTYEIYTTSEYWSYFPRNPLVMEFSFNGQRFIIINNHYKCCGDGNLNLANNGDEETRRYHANRLLKEYIDTYFFDANVILVGDLNDSLSDSSQHNVFQNFIDDANNYLFADIDIAYGSSSNWSFPTWPSHLDHILITNELFDEFENANSSIKVIKIEEYLSGGWSEYDNNVTDHRPVGLKLYIPNTLSVDEESLNKIRFNNYPNPFNSETTFTFSNTGNIDKIEIYSISGQRVKTIRISANQDKATWNLTLYASGIYFAKLVSKNKPIATSKLVLIK